jgi:hypothetical protein
MRRVIKDQPMMLAATIREAGKHEIGLTFGVHRRRRGCAWHSWDVPLSRHGRRLRLTATYGGDER